MKLVIANDHAAVDLKFAILEHLKERGIEVVNIGTDTKERYQYPLAGYRAAKMVASGEADGGVLICGTGIGISLAANKVKGIRAAVCSEPYSAKMAREHNNATMIAFGARGVGEDLAKMIVDSWLDAKFQGGRHAERVALIDEIEETGELSCE